jgi:YgiT-type zinc finger domain-containing protein
MKCAICKNGNTKPGKITVVLEKKDTTLIFKQVPADVCENCGEEYVSADVNRQLLMKASDAFNRNVSLELLQFAA